MNTIYAQAETLSKHWASLGALLRCCRVIGNSNHYFLLSVRAPEVQMQRTKLKALRHVGCALRNFSLSFTCCEIFNSKSYLLTDIDLHQTCLHSSNKKLIIRLSSCQEFKRWLQCGCLREQKFCLSRDWTFAEKENFSKRNYARSDSSICRKIIHIMLPNIFVQAQLHRNVAKAMCNKWIARL